MHDGAIWIPEQASVTTAKITGPFTNVNNSFGAILGWHVVIELRHSFCMNRICFSEAKFYADLFQLFIKSDLFIKLLSKPFSKFFLLRGISRISSNFIQYQESETFVGADFFPCENWSVSLEWYWEIVVWTCVNISAQPTFTCSKLTSFRDYMVPLSVGIYMSRLTTETLKKVWNMFKVNNKDNRRRCFGVFVINLEHISHLALVLLLLTLNM